MDRSNINFYIVDRNDKIVRFREGKNLKETR